MAGKKHVMGRLGRTGAVALCVLCAIGTEAQVVKAPRYQGGVEAPSPQLNLPPLPTPLTPNGTVVEDVVVRVNDQIINRSDVERQMLQLEQDAQQNNMSPTDLAQQRKNMLRDMIDQQLLLSRGKELGLNADADVIRRLDEIRKQNKMESMEDLEKAARQQGVNFEDYKAQIRNQIITQQVVRDEVGRRLQMTQSDETKYYDAHKNDFNVPEQVRLSEILVPLPETATPAEIAQAEKKADGLKTQLMQGQDFAEVAKKSSGGPSATQGGELGLFKRGALAKVLEDQTFALKVGETTQPIRTRQGYVILKVTQHDLAGPAPLKDVESQVQEAMYMQEMQPALRTYLTRLRDQSYIDLQPGFVDSGASQNETKPVFTAYAPPVVKKKKVKAKARFDRGGRASTVAAARPKDVIASPDTTGTRTLTGAEAKNNAVDPATGLGVISAPAKVASGKAPKGMKKEKIRFGQAPRNSLPGEDSEVATTATPVTPGSAAIATAPTGSTALAPGTSSTTAPDGSSSADLADNPLAPKAPEAKKTRLSARAKEEKEKKVKMLSAKQQEKVAATPVAMSTEEKATAQTQAAPLGLAGDTTKKPKKQKEVKGAPKERLQEKQPVAPPVAAPPEQTANPDLAPTATTPPSTRTGGIAAPGSVPNSSAPNSSAPNSSVPNSSVPNSSIPRSVPNQSDTTLPPVTQPVPGSPQQGTPIPPHF